MNKTVECQMKNAFINNQKDSLLYKVLKISLLFWQAIDYYKNSNRAEIFEYMYMTKNGINASVLTICRDCYVDERAVYRYRHEYIFMFLYFVEQIKSNAEYSYLLNFA